MMRAGAVVLLSAAVAALAQQPFVPSVLAPVGSPSQVLYGTYRGAPVRSSDGGATWTPIYVTEPALPQPPIYKLLVDSSNSNTFYLATPIPPVRFSRTD